MNSSFQNPIIASVIADFLNNILLLSKHFFDTLRVLTFAVMKGSLAVLINYEREKFLKPLFL